MAERKISQMSMLHYSSTIYPSHHDTTILRCLYLWYWSSSRRTWCLHCVQLRVCGLFIRALYYLMWRYLTFGGTSSPYVVLFYLMWRRNTLCGVVAPFVALYYFMWPCITWCDVGLPHVAWHYLMWCCMTSCVVVSPYVALYCLM